MERSDGPRLLSKMEIQQRKSSTIGYMALFFLMALPFWLYLANYANQKITLSNQGVPAQATVVTVFQSTRLLTQSITYEYQVDGKTYKTEGVGGSYALGFEGGETIPIRYLASDPERSMPTTARIWPGGPVVVSLIFACLFSYVDVMGVIILGRLRRYARKLEA